MLLGDVLKGDLGASVSNPAAQLAQGPGFAIKEKKSVWSDFTWLGT